MLTAFTAIVSQDIVGLFRKATMAQQRRSYYLVWFWGTQPRCHALSIVDGRMPASYLLSALA